MATVTNVCIGRSLQCISCPKRLYCSDMQGQHSPHGTASEFATQPATVRHYLSNMINAPIPSAASPVKRPTRRQDPEAVSQGCSSPNKWAAARASEEDRNVSSNPNSDPSVNPSSASLSARSELTPAGTPYGTPQVTPTKAAGVRHGAGISINELIRSAREGLPPPQVSCRPQVALHQANVNACP